MPCGMTHDIVNRRCVLDDSGEAHKDLGHKTDFEGLDYYWKPTVDEWARWKRLEKTEQWPEYDCDPTRRSSPVELFDEVARELMMMGYSRFSPNVKVVVATGSPQTPWANVLATSHGTLPDGTPVVVLEL